MPSTTTYQFRACTDCLMLIANGDTSGTARCATEEGEAEYLAAVAANTGNLYLAPSSWPFMPSIIEDSEAIAGVFDGTLDLDSFRFIEEGEAEVFDWSDDDRYYGRDTESEFSMSSCDVCNEGLGGDRHPVAGWERS